MQDTFARATHSAFKGQLARLATKGYFVYNYKGQSIGEKRRRAHKIGRLLGQLINESRDVRQSARKGILHTRTVPALHFTSTT